MIQKEAGTELRIKYGKDMKRCSLHVKCLLPNVPPEDVLAMAEEARGDIHDDQSLWFRLDNKMRL